jgi:FAE1/Type III polyketide synthase-like protein
MVSRTTGLAGAERSNAYRDGACQLFVDAANKALDAAGIGAAEVDTVVTISSTGIATPSLEARAAARVGFRADVERVPVFGLGCAGAVVCGSGFSIRAQGYWADDRKRSRRRHLRWAYWPGPRCAAVPGLAKHVVMAASTSALNND